VTTFVRVPAVAVLVSLAIAAPSLAQDEGVTIDPDSPSAKEYAIPLERERRQADPAREADARIEQGSRSSPLFGEGIESKRARSRNGRTPSRAETAPTGSRTQGGGEPERRRMSRQPVTGSSADAVLRAAANPGAPSGGVDTALVIGTVAALVLAVGGGAGLLLRRRS